MGDWTYDVFLSFRGKDMRQGFIGHLYEALRGRGFHTFLDDVELDRGEDITRSLVKAIEESRIAIPVFSENYATSSFCLDELVKIMECSKTKGQIVLPIFYKVDPSHVRRLRGSYGDALVKHEERFKNREPFKEKDMERLEKWKKALEQAANLSGEHFKLGGESERKLIEKIVEAVTKRIHLGSLHISDHLVGLESQVLEVKSLLDIRCDNGAHMVGIYGIGGIGKTTLARTVYSLIVDSFESACFLGSVRETSITHGLVYLQEMLLSKLVGVRDVKLGDVTEGINMIKHRLRPKKVLLVVDDVDNLDQLEAIVGDSKWFGLDSKVIITTRNKGLLASHGIKSAYGVDELNFKESHDLLRWNAFKNDKVDPSYADILNRIVAYASGLPLALEVIGSNLFGKSIEEWKSALDQYKRIPKKEIQHILKISFDDLEEAERNFFLDIACFFNHCSFEYIVQTLRAHHGNCPKYGIRVLVDKSLIKIDNKKNVTLHDLIQDMGREIVRQESPQKPGKRSRIWFFEDIKHVLEEDKGSSKIEIIKLEFPKFGEKVNWDGEAFKKMDNLKTLIINNGHFLKGLKHLPSSLRVLEWLGYPSELLPSNFHPKKLARLKLSNSFLSSLYLSEPHEKFMNLKVLSFNQCRIISRIPDVSAAPNLEELSFRWCENLIDVDKSVGLLNKLTELDAFNCCNLESFPALMLPSLGYLCLSYCSSLDSFPEILGNMENLTELELEKTSIKELPLSIRYLTRLQKLALSYSRIFHLPSSVFELEELEHLEVTHFDKLLLHIPHNDQEKVNSMEFSYLHVDFSHCNASDEFLRMVVPWLANVIHLDLSWNKFTVLPACIKGCSFLKVLILDSCFKLQEIREVPPNIETISTRNCISLKVLPACTKECQFLKELNLIGCENLQEVGWIPPHIETLLVPKCIFLTSSCRSMLLNQDQQDLQKEGADKEFSLPVPGTKISKWFNHSCKGSSISFWFHHKFPVITLCVFGERIDNPFALELIINDRVVHTFPEFYLVQGHVYILALGKKLIKFKDEMDDVLSTNEWNHVILSNVGKVLSVGTQLEFGLFIEQRSRMEDIRFTDPLLPEEEHRLVDHDAEWDSNSVVSKPTSSITGVLAYQDHLAKAHGESSQALAFADETQNMQTPSPTSSSGQVSGREGIYIMQTTFDEESSRKQDLLIQDDAEMEAFYASLDAAGTNVLSCSYDDKSPTTASPSEEAKEALKSVQDFISSDASVMLHPERCHAMKSSLDYLSNLSTDDGISGELQTLISEASWFFTHWGRDYIEASMKIESTTSEMQRADELKASLEANKNRFKDVVALENELLQKLACMEKSKKELEEQINAIKANLLTCVSEKNNVVLRKSDIFEEGKTLKAQIDELRGKVPRLQHEQGLAKKIQEKFAIEWSKLGEKFKTIVED